MENTTSGSFQNDKHKPNMKDTLEAKLKRKKKAAKTTGTDFRFMKAGNNECETTIITSVMTETENKTEK